MSEAALSAPMDSSGSNDNAQDSSDEAQSSGSRRGITADSDSSPRDGSATPSGSSQRAKPKDPPKPQKHKFKTKDGDEFEADEDEIAEWRKSREALSKQGRELSQLRQLAKAISTGDFAVINKLAETSPELKKQARKWMEESLLKEIEYEEMSEDEKARLQERQELEALRREKEEIERREQQRKRQESYQKANEDIQSVTVNAFKEAGIPMTPRRILRFAELLDVHVSSLKEGELPNLQEFAAKSRAISRIRNDLELDTVEVLESMDGSKLYEFLSKKSPKTLDAIRQSLLQDAQAKASPFARPSAQKDAQEQSKPRQGQPKKLGSIDEYFANIEKRLNA